MAKEITRLITCPTCQYKFTITLRNFQGQIHMQCSKCGRILASWIEGDTRQHVVKPTGAMPRFAATEQKITPGAMSKTSDRIVVPNQNQRPVMAPQAHVPMDTNPATSPSPALAIQQAQQKGLKRIKDYQILSKIGSGAMGEIYLAQHVGNNRQVAIKVLSQKMQKDPKAVERFTQEVRVHTSLSHPNIVHIFDCGSYSERMFLVMEYVNGESLEQILTSRGSILAKHSLKIAVAVAHALEHAHNHKIIHRDLKPANILIDKNTRKVKLADFGLGKNLEEKGATQTGQMMGTPYYMAPEQIKNAKQADHRADIYSLGATLYHMLSGQPPYGEIKGTLSILRAKITQDPLPLVELVAGLEPEVAEVAQKAMSRKAEKRYQNPTEMSDAISAVLEKSQ